MQLMYLLLPVFLFAHTSDRSTNAHWIRRVSQPGLRSIFCTLFGHLENKTLDLR